MHYYTFFHTLFVWPTGILDGNLIASVVWAIIAAISLWLYHKLVIVRNHEEMKDMLNPDTPGGMHDVIERLRDEQKS